MASGPDRVKPNIITLVFVTSPLSSHHQEERAKIGWLGIEIMCPSGTTRNVVSVSIHYKYPSKHVSIMEGLTSSSSRLNTGS